MRILILGGTGEARALANALVDMGHEVTTSLAGRTHEPQLPKGNVRTGGFGGADWLAAYLKAEQFDRLVDATHPYAVQISANAVEAAAAANVPLVRFVRPAWVEPLYAFWHHVPDATAAASELPRGARALLTIGHKGLEPFLARTDCTFLIRTIEMPERPLPAHAWAIQGRPPFTLADETELMRREKISHLVAKNSGGVQTEAKLHAAQNLGLTTIIIDRPQLAPAMERQSLGRVIAALRLDRP